MTIPTNWKTIAPITGTAALLLFGIAGQFESEGAGSLTPPTGTPTPTMPSLEEIGAKLDPLGSTGKNFALRNNTNVQVWNSSTGLWTPGQTVSGLASVVESDGNFCAIGNAGGAVWSKTSGSWKVVTNITSATALTKSNGNFCMIGSSRATAWSQVTDNWKTISLSGPIRVESSNGNFLVIGASQAAAYSQVTGNWTIQALSPSFVGTASADD